MHRINVELPNAAYPIFIGGDALTECSTELVSAMPQARAVIVTNETVAPLYLDHVKSRLVAEGVDVSAVVLPDGEAHKQLETIEVLLDRLLEMRCERKTALVALGGGVVGDITGFAAAIYQRGMPFFQIPTTLLAQVDSSVGGKTGVNHARGKNMIGAFYQPRMVLIDLEFLKTLPDREFSAGLAEVIKYGLIADRDFFDWLSQNIVRLMERDPSALEYAIARSCEIKAELVAADERESGVRALLNLGHTFGHAIEAGLGYGVRLHGEAVAVGMVLAARAANMAGDLSEPDCARIVALLEAAGHIIDVPELGYTRWLELMQQDKKVDSGRIKFVLLRSIGEAYIGELNEAVLRKILP
ncbi:3-dehydroquinate synthase [Chitinimonas sp.]|uniref:3-dehydroquinate synthase n=1 Tax=Chitinimonas sp. TaxID=1934313 RepID=UPI0035B289F3